MGFLNERAQVGANIGGFAAGGADAAGLASRSMGLGTLSTGLDITGDLLQGISGLQQGQFAAMVARQNAEAALRAGQDEETASRMRYGALEASQKVAAAANGVQVSSGSPLAVRRSTEQISQMDALAIRYNAARQAYAERVQGELAAQAGRNLFARGLLGAGKDFISGSASLADKWLSFKQTGIGGTTILTESPSSSRDYVPFDSSLSGLNG